MLKTMAIQSLFLASCSQIKVSIKPILFFRKMQAEGQHPVHFVLKNMQPGLMDAVFEWVRTDVWIEAPAPGALPVAWLMVDGGYMT